MTRIEQRFWSKVEQAGDDECWEWQASTHESGYGQFRGEETMLAHRAAYRLINGNPGRNQVLHTCDNRLCVNPTHLYLGDQQDNIDDAVERGRMAKGEDNGSSKLTKDDAGEIKYYLENTKANYADIAELYDVHEETVGAIAREETWTWAPAKVPEVKK